MLTTNRIMNGEFEVFWNGVNTRWFIINGSSLSGRGNNTYGILSPKGKVYWIGSLQSCKQVIENRIKEGKIKKFLENN